MMVIPTFKMLWLTMVLAALVVLVAGVEKNTTSTASPKVQVSTTTPPPPPLAPVMDLFQAPLAAFKPKMHETDMPMGRDQQSSSNTPAPSNIFIKAGNGLGSAASSLTGWFNNRMIPQAFRPSSTTTAAPQVFAIVPSQQFRRKVYIDAGNERRRPQGQIPVMVESDDLEDEEEELNDNDDDEDNYNSISDVVQYDDEEDDDDYDPVEKRKDSRQTQNRPNRQYYYIEEELPESDDFDYDVQLPVRKPQRKQQNLVNRRRKTPPKKKQQTRRKPLRRIQNPQTVQYVQNRPSKTQVKRQRRPPTTFELIPISQNQAVNSAQNTQSSSQNNSQRPLSQFLSIPWSRLGFSGPSKEPTTTEQQSKPIIVQIPQQNVKRKRRPAKKPVQAVKNPKRKTFRGQLQNQSPVFSILSEDQIRELFNTQVDQPSQTTVQTSNLPVTLDSKKKPPKKESEEVPSYNNDNEPEEKPQAESQVEKDEEDSFIVVGPADDDEDKEVDLNLYRQYNNQRGFKRGRASPRISHRWESDDEYDE